MTILVLYFSQLLAIVVAFQSSVVPILAEFVFDGEGVCILYVVFYEVQLMVV